MLQDAEPLGYPSHRPQDAPRHPLGVTRNDADGATENTAGPSRTHNHQPVTEVDHIGQWQPEIRRPMSRGGCSHRNIMKHPTLLCPRRGKHIMDTTHPISRSRPLQRGRLRDEAFQHTNLRERCRPVWGAGLEGIGGVTLDYYTYACSAECVHIVHIYIYMCVRLYVQHCITMINFSSVYSAHYCVL